MAWYFGNIHCHSNRSDGDSPAEAVARFYRAGGMQFVAITDHNLRTAAEHCGEVGDGFVVLPGSEYTTNATIPGRGYRPLHVGGIGVAEGVAPSGDESDAVAVLQRGVDLVRAAGGIAVFNHPNWFWGFAAEEMKRVRGATAFELWNGAPSCNNAGDAEHASTEAMWDEVLTAGGRLLGFASDDCHRFAERSLGKEMPFSGWVCAWAERLDVGSIVAALGSGRCYASTGPRFSRLALSRDLVEAEVEAWDACSFTATAIGAGGRVLAVQSGRTVSYRPTGDEGYVRLRVDNGQGYRAWTQPVFLDDPATWWSSAAAAG